MHRAWTNDVETNDVEKHWSRGDQEIRLSKPTQFSFYPVVGRRDVGFCSASAQLLEQPSRGT